MKVLCVAHALCRSRARHVSPEGAPSRDHQHLDCLFNCLLRRTSEKTSKLRITGPCEGNPPVTGGFHPPPPPDTSFEDGLNTFMLDNVADVSVSLWWICSFKLDHELIKACVEYVWIFHEPINHVSSRQLVWEMVHAYWMWTKWIL